MAELPVDVINNPAIVLPKTLTYLEFTSLRKLHVDNFLEGDILLPQGLKNFNLKAFHKFHKFPKFPKSLEELTVIYIT